MSEHGSNEWLAEENTALSVEAANLRRRIHFLRTMMEKARDNIGVPGPGYAEPITFAYYALDNGLKSDAGEKPTTDPPIEVIDKFDPRGDLDIARNIQRMCRPEGACNPLIDEMIAEAIQGYVGNHSGSLAWHWRRANQAELIMRELDNTFSGRDDDGAPSADGSYWLGHSLALRVWYWLHPEKIPSRTPNF